MLCTEGVLIDHVIVSPVFPFASTRHEYMEFGNKNSGLSALFGEKNKKIKIIYLTIYLTDLCIRYVLCLLCLIFIDLNFNT